MKPEVLIKLVNSLSKAEKRAFRLATKKQTGNKDYVQLFHMIDRLDLKSPKTLAENFRKKFPDVSFHTVSSYLGKIVIESLISNKVNKDKNFKFLYGLLELQILKERNLRSEAHKLITQLKKEAQRQEELPILYMLGKEELDYHSSNNFKGISENMLIGFQVSARELLREMRNTHEHRSLYESLKYRFLESSKSVAISDKNMDDLILSELSIVNTRTKHNLESQKLHLLFQSFFFMHIRDYKAALKTFNDLNRLFEEHIDKLKQPPLDYFSMLNGILDSLRSINRFDEMPYYITKLKQLANPEFPEHFVYLVKKTALVYELVNLNGNYKNKEAMNCISQNNSEIWSAYSLTDPEKQSELQFYTALTYFRNKNLKKAIRHINQVILIKSGKQLSSIFRACKLLGLILHYEDGDLDFLDNEVRSYKRTFSSNQKMWLIEKMVLHTIMTNPKRNSAIRNKKIWEEKFLPIEKNIQKSNTEIQLLKYFNFLEWVQDTFLQRKS